MLAAGRSSRFGSNKLLHKYRGETLLARALRACGSYPALVVTNAELIGEVERAGKTGIINDRPDRGMTHSLRLANERVDPEDTVAILPADLADITADHVASVVERAEGADVCFPVRSDGTPGHPVVFSSNARRYIAALPDGDTIRALRDRDGLTKRTIIVDDDWPYKDVDVRGDLPPD